jgi:hypothetical protein
MDYNFYNALRQAVEDYKTDQGKNIRAVVCDLKFSSIMKQTTAISKKRKLLGDSITVHMLLLRSV